MSLDGCTTAASSGISSQLDCGIRRHQKREKDKPSTVAALAEVNTNRTLPRCPVAPPSRPAAAAASSMVRRGVPHEPIVGLKQVDSDSDDGGDADIAVPRVVLPRFPRVNVSGPPSRAETPSGSFCRTPSFRPSGSVSRQASDAVVSRQPSANLSRQPSAAGSGVHAVRQAGWSATSTPTHSRSVSQRPSRTSSFAGAPGVPLSDNQHGSSTASDAQWTQEPSGPGVSRRGSARVLSQSTPDCRSDIKRRRQEEALQQVEDDIARRQALFAPENVLVRRWLSLAVLCASARLLIEGGGKRVRAFNSKLYALHVLETRFVPMWRLHNVIRKRKARQVMGRFILRCVVRRRLQRRNQSVDIVKDFLRNKSGMFRAYARWFKGRVVVVQRAFRRFKCRRDAMVELNFRFCRKFEEGYWSCAAKGALEVLQNRFLIEINAAKAAAESSGRGGGRRRFTHSGDAAAVHVDMVPPALPATYPTRQNLGPIPESIVKKCIRPLLTRKAREYQKEIHRRMTAACESMKRARRGSMEAIRKVPDTCRRSVVVKLPPFRPFLTSMEVYEALDHAALTLSVLRDQPILALHLADGKAATVPAQDELILTTQLSGDALQSDRLTESGDSRRCSLSDLFVFGVKSSGK